MGVNLDGQRGILAERHNGDAPAVTVRIRYAAKGAAPKARVRSDRRRHISMLLRLIDVDQPTRALRAFDCVLLRGVPLDVVAERFGMTPEDVLEDARRGLNEIAESVFASLRPNREKRPSQPKTAVAASGPDRGE